MSGGHFSYAQYRMEDISIEIDELIDKNDSDDGYHYPPHIIKRFAEASHTTKQALEMVQRVDWLVSGDAGEESFMSRWDDEVRDMFDREKL